AGLTPPAVLAMAPFRDLEFPRYGDRVFRTMFIVGAVAGVLLALAATVVLFERTVRRFRTVMHRVPVRGRPPAAEPPEPPAEGTRPPPPPAAEGVGVNGQADGGASPLPHPSPLAGEGEEHG